MRSFRRLTAIACAVAVVVAVAACGSSSNKTTSSSTPSSTPSSTAANFSGVKGKTIKVTAILDKTGIAGATGTQAEAGINFGLKELQAAEPDVKIDLTVVDTQSVQTTAVSEASQAVSSGAQVVMFGNLSNEALAIAPILQKAGIPAIFIQSGAPGTTQIGEHIFRVTGLQTAQQYLEINYLKSKGVKTIASIYDSDIPTTADLVNQTLPPLLKSAGIKQLSATAVTSTTTDFTAEASKIAAEKPDAVYASMLGAPYITLYNDLAQDGWHGQFAAMDGISYGVLPSLGKAATNVSYATDFVPETTIPAGAAFAKAYQASTGQPASEFAAEGYDAVTFLKLALAQASGVTTSDITAALTKVADTGFDGIGGKTTFTDRSASVPGIVAVYNHGVITVPVVGK